MNVVYFMRADGVMGMMSLAQEERRLDEPEADWFARIIAKDIPPDATEVTILPLEARPGDSLFWPAFFVMGGAVRVNMAKARNVWRDRLRAARGPAFALLDIAYQRADEIGDEEEKRRIVARKQALRDAPADPRIDAAASLVELQEVWPEGLGR